MKRVLALLVILAIAGGSLYLAQHRTHQDAVSPNAVLDVAADWQRDVSRAPMQLTRLSDAEETRIGDSLAQQYGAAEPLKSSDDLAMQQYVAAVGERVARHAKRKLNYRFHYLPDKDLINAFALPGGHVFIGQGLLDIMTSEDELAFVLGHEIEHIDHYHAAERVQIEAHLEHLNLDIVAALAQIPVSLWQAGYSKEQEFEADREGLRLAFVASYSPQGAENLMEKFGALEREYVIHSETPAEELTQVAIEGLNGYFRTHPLPSERLAQIKTIIVEDHLDTKRPMTPFNTTFGYSDGKIR